MRQVLKRKYDRPSLGTPDKHDIAKYTASLQTLIVMVLWKEDQQQVTKFLICFIQMFSFVIITKKQKLRIPTILMPSLF